MKNISSLTDEQLVEVSQKDMEKFRFLIERYEKKLLFYILRISSCSSGEAEELLQEVFLKTWQNLNRFDSSLKFSSWIYRITHNEVISWFRRYRSRSEETAQNVPENIFDLIPTSIDIVGEFDKNLDRELIHKVLQGMESKYREVLVLHFLEEKSYEEISDILKKPLGTVGTLINRAKKIFKDSLSRHNISFL